MFQWIKNLFIKKIKPDGNDKFLLVGINCYKNSPLSGCINDIMSFEKMLIELFGVSKEKITVLMDGDATTKNIKESLKWLSDITIKNACFFHFSGHGTQVPSKSKDEPDGLCEAICPVDFDWTPKRMIIDDDFVEIFSTIPNGTRFYWTSDSCHSGDLTNLTKSIENTTRICTNIRSMPVPEEIAEEIRKLKFNFIARKLLNKSMSNKLDVGFISACKSNQTAADTIINGTPCGAFSFFLEKNLRKNKELPLYQIAEFVRNDLKNNKIYQDPQEEGNRIKMPFLK